VLLSSLITFKTRFVAEREQHPGQQWVSIRGSSESETNLSCQKLLCNTITVRTVYNQKQTNCSRRIFQFYGLRLDKRIAYQERFNHSHWIRRTDPKSSSIKCKYNKYNQLFETEIVLFYSIVH
jgi:hypothetical protein